VYDVAVAETDKSVVLVSGLKRKTKEEVSEGKTVAVVVRSGRCSGAVS
jgi:hypothetical protein